MQYLPSTLWPTVHILFLFGWNIFCLQPLESPCFLCWIFTRGGMAPLDTSNGQYRNGWCRIFLKYFTLCMNLKCTKTSLCSQQNLFKWPARTQRGYIWALTYLFEENHTHSPDTPPLHSIMHTSFILLDGHLFFTTSKYFFRSLQKMLIFSTKCIFLS